LQDGIVGEKRGILINNWCNISEAFYIVVKGNGERIIIPWGTLETINDVTPGIYNISRGTYVIEITNSKRRLYLVARYCRVVSWESVMKLEENYRN
jgi:hypothetical protein